MEAIDMYARYIQEREGLTLIREEGGFITYKIFDDILFINDVFVMQEHRQGNTFFRLAKQAEMQGKMAGAKKIRGLVWINTSDPTHSLKAIMSYGLKVVGSEKNVIILEKEI
jgi:hypothetical protein